MIESEISGLEKSEIILIDENGHSEAEVEMVPAERNFTFRINKKVEVEFCCTPHRIRSLVVGWLMGEGIIESSLELGAIESDYHTRCIDIQVDEQCLARAEARIRNKEVLPVFENDAQAITIESAFEVKPPELEQLAASFRKLFLSLQSAERMCYLSCIAENGEIMTYGEGFHRITSFYRCLGELLLQERGTERKVLLTNYGLCRRLVSKLVRSGIAIAICLAPPTSSAIELANSSYLSVVTTGLGIGTKIYSCPWRII